MTIQIRRAIESDRQDILRISAQVWDGSDYVPAVLSKWLAPEGGILWVAVVENQVAGFSRMTFLNSEQCWMEGIRVDEAHREKGIGKALTDFQVKEAFNMNFKSCGLSSYIENTGSLKILRTDRFTETGRFKFFCYEGESESNKVQTTRREILEGCFVKPLDSTQVELVQSAIEGSDMLQQRQGYLSYDWTFERYTPSFIQERVAAGDFYLLVKDDRQTIFSFSAKHSKGSYRTVNYISNETLEPEVLAYAMETTIAAGEKATGYMAADANNLPVAETLGMIAFCQENQDVFVFEKKGRE